MAARNEQEGADDQSRPWNSLLDQIIEAASDPIWVKDRESRFILVNTAAARVLGHSRAELIGRIDRDIISPEYAARFADEDRRIMDCGESITVEEQVVDRETGEPRVFMSRKTPLRGPGGQITGMLGIARDISDRKRFEAEAVAREAQLRTILETVPVGIVMAELPSGRIVEGNAQVEKMLRHPVLPAGDVDSHDEWVSFDANGHRVAGDDYPLARIALDGEEAPEIEVHYQRGDGSRAWTRIMGRPVRDEQGQLVGGVVALVDIDAQRRAEEEAARAAREFQTLADNIPTLCWMAYADGHIYWYNRRWYDYTGVDPEDLTGWGWEAVHDPAVLPLVLTRWRQSIETGDPFEMTFPLKGADGVFRPFLTRIVPIRDEGGAIIRWFGTNTDVTELKAAETALRASEATLSAVLDALPVGVIIADAQGRIVRDNAANRELWGIAPDSQGWEDHGDWAGWRGDTGERLDADEWAMARALLNGETVRGELIQNQRFDSAERRFFLNNAAPVRDERGEIIAVVVAQQDVTDLILAEAERRRLIAVLEASPDFVGTADAEGRTTYLNPAARRMAGLAPDAPIEGVPITSFHPPDAAAMLVETAMPQARRTGLWEGESLIRMAGGETLPVSQVILAHRDASGEIDFYSTVARDISERTAAEDRERLLAREVDHRAKNLLAVVQSVVQLTRAETVAGFKEAITGRVHSLARAHSLLAASRWEGVELGPLVEEELAPFKRGDAERVEITGPPLRLKPAAAQAIALVLHELATNAVKYGALSADEGRLHVSWKQIERAGTPHLTLIWTERGGPPVTTPSRRGFGSTVIRSSVERQLKGTVDLEWHAEGLMGALTFPADQVVVMAEIAPSAPAATPRAAPARCATPAGRKVLVVEDEALIAAQLEAVLREAGCTVIGPAANPRDAIELIERERPDVAVLDVNLNGERSDGVADALAARGVPFLFCTGYAGGGGAARFADAPVLSKPLDPGELLRTLATLG